MWINVLFSKKNVDKWTDGHTYGQTETDKQTLSINKQELRYNSANQSCQKDNIARRRQPYVNSNHK